MGKRERREEGSGQGTQLGPEAPQTQSEGADRPLLQALHRLVGNQGVDALEKAGAADSMSLYLRHLSQVSEGLQVDTSAYMPDVAPQSWMREIVPLYDVLSQDRALLLEQGSADEATSIHADTSSSTAQTDASVVAPVSRLASGMNVIDDDVDAVADFDKLMGQAGMGRALSAQEQAFLTRVHGREFSEIRVHEGGASDKAAEQIHAKAFARDSDIYVAGRIDVNTAGGAELLAHEATHVVQAEEGRLPQATGSGLQVSDPSQAHEREADQVGKQAAQTVREDGGDDPWGLERVPIFDSTGQAIVDHLGQVLPDLSLLDADHRTALESTLSAGRDHVESDGLLDSLAGDLVGSAAPAVSSSGSGLALHREAESGAVSPEASTSSGGLQEADSSQEGVLDSEHQTNTEGVWLVSDPSRYSETIVERLPAGTRLIVLERGEEQPFNQTDSSYQWWLVALVEGGGTGWVMQVLATPVSQSDSQSLGESGDLEEEDLSESSSQEELFDSYEQNFCEQDGPVLTAFDTSVLSSQIETPASPSFSDPQGSGAGIVISLFGQFLSGLVSKVGTSPADYDRRLVQAQASQALQKEIEALNTPEMAAHLLNIYLGSEDEPPQQFVTLGFGIGCIVLQQIGYQEIIEDFQGAVAAVEIASGLGNLDGALLREKTMAVAEPLRLEAEEGWGSKNAYVQYHHQVEEVDLEQIFGDRVQYLESVEQSEMSLEHESDSEQSESETQ